MNQPITQPDTPFEVQLAWLQQVVGSPQPLQPFVLRNGVQILGVQFFAQHLLDDLTNENVPGHRFQGAKSDLADFFSHLHHTGAKTP